VPRASSGSRTLASRIVGRLEKEIGASLFTRSTRALALTEAGAEYLARVEPALAASTTPTMRRVERESCAA